MSLIRRQIERWEALALNPWEHTEPTEAEDEFTQISINIMTRAAEAQEAGNTDLADELWAEHRRLNNAYEHLRSTAWETWREDMERGK